MLSLGPVRDSVKQINSTSWLIGSKHILRHIQGPYAGEYLQKNNDGSCYTISEAPATLPDTEPIRQTSHVRQVHDAGDASAVFSFGDTLILKVKLISEGGGPQEHETLAFLFEPHMPGRRLNEAWWDMDAKEKEHISTRIAHICSELTAFQSSFITGVDHKWTDPLREPRQRDYSPEALQKHCEELGMDCLIYVLSHNDLGPTNILINGDQIVIIDWDLAGYCPVAWVRTKFAVCGAKKMEKTRMAEWIKRRPWLQ